MSAINLEKSIGTLRKCYTGKVMGQHVIDASKVDDLVFKFAMFRVNLALENKEITEKELYKQLKRKK